MFSFLSLEDVVNLNLVGTYNLALVAASYLVAAVAAFSGLRLARYAERDGEFVWHWLLIGGFTMGFGVWSMHFIGMLAFELPIPVSYNAAITVGSMLPAIIGCTAGLALLRRGLPLNGHIRRLLAGAIIGAGIGAMHYTGMAAMRMNAVLYYDQTWFILSIVVAVVLGVIGVYAEKLREFNETGWLALPFQVASAAVLGLSITGMHYVAMQAAICIPTLGSGVSADRIISPVVLATAVSLASVIIAAIGLIAVKVDSRMRAAQKIVQVTQERMFAAIESISDGFLLFDENGTLLLHNAVFAGMYPSLGEVLKPGSTYEEILRVWAQGRDEFPDSLDRESYIQMCLNAFHSREFPADQSDEDKLFDGRWAVVRQSPIAVGGLVSVWHDVTAIKKQQDIYKELALTDGLTKLANRTAFMERLKEAIKRNKRHEKKVALMFIDLDKFKPVNDTHGHDAGDFVLTSVAARLSNLVRETDLVARIGGDEFVIILEQVTGFEDIEKIAQKVLEEIRAPIEFNGKDCSVGGSIGISVNPDHAMDEESLIKVADNVMYKVKEAGRNNFMIHGYDHHVASAGAD
jgi:diguanylate cyclase (GGDEF)-like protein